MPAYSRPPIAGFRVKEASSSFAASPRGATDAPTAGSTWRWLIANHARPPGGDGGAMRSSKIDRTFGGHPASADARVEAH